MELSTTKSGGIANNCGHFSGSCFFGTRILMGMTSFKFRFPILWCAFRCWCLVAVVVLRRFPSRNFGANNLSQFVQRMLRQLGAAFLLQMSPTFLFSLRVLLVSGQLTHLPPMMNHFVFAFLMGFCFKSHRVAMPGICSKRSRAFG